MDPPAHRSDVHPPRQLDPGRAMVALHQVHQVQQQDEGYGDVRVADVAWWLSHCPLYGVPKMYETSLEVSR